MKPQTFKTKEGPLEEWATVRADFWSPAVSSVLGFLELPKVSTRQFKGVVMSTIATIVCAVDVSDHSRVALGRAGAWA